MAYTLPVFNLVARIWGQASGPPPIHAAPRLTVSCQLRFPIRSAWFIQTATFPMLCMLPPLTDVRMDPSTDLADWMEIPAASGRWYTVVAVDDIAKGFANEHRVALVQLFQPVPIPLP